MTKILTYLSVAVALSACSTLPKGPRVTIQTTSDLPNCRGSNASTWTNCFGTYTYANGENFAVEYKDGKFNGQGTYTWANGNKYVGEGVVRQSLTRLKVQQSYKPMKRRF